MCTFFKKIPRQFPTDIYTIEKKKKNKMKKGKREKYRCVTALKSKYNKMYRFNKVHEARSIVRS